MAKLPPLDHNDPVLDAINRALEAQQEDTPRAYLGASAIGQSCERRLWLDFRWARKRSIGAAGLCAIDDGHRGERIMADRLRMVPGITLITEDESGNQIGFADLGGHFRGNADGLIEGLPQAKAMHVWECKIANEKKFEKLIDLKTRLGEKAAFSKWDATYYAQAQIYMHYLGAHRHYLTVGSPGVRRMVTVRTEYDAMAAMNLIAKAQRIIEAQRMPVGISTDPSWYECRFCPHYDGCHAADRSAPTSAASNCRTCLHSTPLMTGGWHCARFDKMLDVETQRAGCPAHLYIPDLIDGEQIDAGDDWVAYRLLNGEVWRDGKQED
jgi:hypothetical protein